MTVQRMKFDPRTKLLLLFTMAVFVLGGAASDLFNDYLPIFCMIPIVLLLCCGNGKGNRLFCNLHGFLLRIHICVVTIIWCIGIYCTCNVWNIKSFLPGIITGEYLMQTTTVSEFNAAMGKMHVTEKITIPLSVMFRFFSNYSR